MDESWVTDPVCLPALLAVSRIVLRVLGLGWLEQVEHLNKSQFRHSAAVSAQISANKEIISNSPMEIPRCGAGVMALGRSE